MEVEAIAYDLRKYWEFGRYFHVEQSTQELIKDLEEFQLKHKGYPTRVQHDEENGYYMEYFKTEADKEYKQRMAILTKYIIIEEQKERAELARLKEKYDVKD